MSRCTDSCAVLAWTVPMQPSCPVFIAVKSERASAPRTSPTISRSGRMRSVFFSNASMSSPESPALPGLTVSSWTWCSCSRWISVTSSMVISRSRDGMKRPSMFNVVVFPEPVPPETRMLQGAAPIPSTNIQSSAASRGVSVPKRMRSTKVSGSCVCLRIVSVGPPGDAGGSVALTRLPSGSRPSNSRLSSPTLRPT